MPAGWHAPLPAFLWQVMLHSTVAGFLLYAWARRVGLPSGRAKRRLLTLLLVLPLFTAAVPGRAGPGFRERLAWLDSERVLAVPLAAGLHVFHVALAVAAVTAAVTLGQELLPLLRRRASPADVPPETLVRLARGLPGWERCAVVSSPAADIRVATGGRPGRPRLVVSRGALARLAEEELAAVIRHEHAHWRDGRWERLHALFLLRLLQCHSPVALWTFREYCVEVEIECDAAAVAERDPQPLARTLLAIYESLGRRDPAARSALRKRTDVLLGDAPLDDAALPPATIAVAAATLLAVLPWLV